MSVIDVLRPISVLKTAGAVAVPGGTLATVTADNSDASYIDFNLSIILLRWVLRVGPHTPAPGYQRHQVRGRWRARTDAGTSTDRILLGRATSDYLHFDFVPLTTVVTELTGSWYQDAGYGLGTPGALTDLNIGGGFPSGSSGGATENRTMECYVDIDCRLQPQFSPEIRDAAGVDQTGGTVTDTNQPTLYFGGVAYDDLPADNWALFVYDAASNLVFSDSGLGTPPTEVDVDTGLDNGSYTASFVVSSTIRGADPFTTQHDLGFSIGNLIPPPSPPLVSVVQEGDGYRVTWTNPGGQEWDNDYVVTEVWRDDCTGSQRIATVPDGLNGSYLDLAIPQLDPLPSGPDCEVSTEPCDITYRVRYFGYVSTTVELPDALPAELILGWPNSAASIPAGWSRVTSLDGYYPRGASGTGAPITTGGAASHSHVTPSHNHTIAAHSHPVGGSTGVSTDSVNTLRENGATYPQADQGHTHTRPANTGTSGPYTSGSATPGTTVANNLPSTREVIWIKSDGARTAYPIGILGWSLESVSGWDIDPANTDRYLKGAAAAGNGGAFVGSQSHLHTVNSHSHTGANHDHSLANSGLSNPLSSLEAGTGTSTPRWLPRHTHPLNITIASTGNTDSVSGGIASPTDLEPPNRRLNILANTSGGIQTRIIGLYTGTVAALDPILTLCDGTSGTPDMRTWFARDRGTDSLNSTGGASTHTHFTPSHTHNIGGHSHPVTVVESNTGTLQSTGSSPQGTVPHIDHIHLTVSTSNASPDVTPYSRLLGLEDSANIPPYHEVHFVRLDGVTTGGPLPVPELKVSDFSSATVPSFTYGDDLDRLSTFTERMAVTTDRSHAYPRLVADSIPLDGGLHTVSTTLAGEDMDLTIGVEGLPAINALEELLRSDRVYWSPIGGTPGWFAPAGWTVRAPVMNVKVLQIVMVRQPWPETEDPEVYL